MRLAEIAVHHPGYGPVVSQSVTVHSGGKFHNSLERKINDLGIDGHIPKGAILLVDGTVLYDGDGFIPGGIDDLAGFVESQ
jgi:hypothetical protein